MPKESRKALIARAHLIFEELGRLYPEAHCELDFVGPLQLLVATILSAQSTDRRVNGVTGELFAKYPDAAAFASADRAELERIIYPTGFFRNKADALLKLSAALIADHGGVVPGTLDELVKLPGVGRKTANVVLNEAFNVPGLTTDTHFIRLARRFAWTKAADPARIEQEVGKLFEPGEYNLLNHRLIWHGRRRCHARRPACGACPVAKWCPALGEGPTDPDAAKKLIREPRG
ncbi:MAG: endonuclease III [Propionibacteriaceae bacterium]|jgi:endonuclease-3|nr:endonuclease III [Propionibacteriaceae bacterium]